MEPTEFKVTSKTTKAELLQAFEELKKLKTSLETQLRQLTREKKPETIAPVASPPPIETKIMPQTSPVSIQQTIQNLEQLQISFGSAVSNLSEQLIKEATRLKELDSSVTEEIEALQELHQVETVEEDTLLNLIEEHRENSKNFTQEYQEQKERLELEIHELKQACLREKISYQISLKERNENYQKEKQRGEEEYWYSLLLERQLDNEEYQQEKKVLYQRLEEIRNNQEQEWQEKEESINKKEQEYQEAQEKVKNFEAQLEAKLKQGKEEGKGIGFYQAKIKSDLRIKEVEGEKQNYALRIQSLEVTINSQQSRIEHLSQQLAAALKQVQDLAVKAIEGNSNRNSYDAIKEIALEQAKNQMKGK